MRKRNRELEQDADVSRRFGRAAPPVKGNEEDVLTEVKDNLLVKNHIQTLNEIIGNVCLHVRLNKKSHYFFTALKFLHSEVLLMFLFMHVHEYA